jgi:hypothetical protein
LTGTSALASFEADLAFLGDLGLICATDDTDLAQQTGGRERMLTDLLPELNADR